MAARADDIGGNRQIREIDVRGKIGFARRLQRVGEGMTGDRLQGFTQSLPGMAVIDDQRHAVVAHAPADIEGDRVGAPLIDRAVRAIAQFTRQRRVEIRQRVGCGANDQRAIVGDGDNTLVPAVGLLDRLMHRQRVDEFVGDDDDRAVGNLGERGVPPHRHVEVGETLALQGLQLRADLNQMQHERGIKFLGGFCRP